MCRDCGSILSPVSLKESEETDLPPEQNWLCNICEGGGHIETIAVPYVFRYFVAELAAMNIGIKINRREFLIVK